MQSPFLEFDSILAESIADAFLTYSADASYAGACAAPAAIGVSVVASIGFAADGTRGNLTIVGPVSTATALCEAAGSAAGAAEMCDVFAELSNMLLGRLKNRLLGRGVTLLIGLPTAETAHDVRVQAGESSSSWHMVTAGGGACHVRLAACFDDDFAFDDQAPESNGAMAAEGEMLFF